MTVYSFDGAFANLNNSISNLGKGFEEEKKRAAIGKAGQKLASGDHAGAAQDLLAYGDVTNGLKAIELGRQQAESATFNQGLQGLMGGEGGLGSIGVVAPAQPVAGAQTLANLGSPNQVETRFMGAAREAGLNNPVGLAALGATGLRESGWSPSKANATWSDPSQSGQPGTSGGILSWRGPRLQAMHKFAQSRGEQPGNVSPETQALFAFQEDPTLVHRLNAAKTPEEANNVMAQAWRYAGYDGSGPEHQARLNATRQYVARYNGQGGQPTQVAQSAQQGPSTADRAQMAIQRVDMLLEDPDRQLTPEHRQSLQDRRQKYVQMAQEGQPPQQSPSQADMPAQGAMEAQQAFQIPGTGEVVPAGTRLTQRAVNMIKMLGANVPDSRKEPVRQLLKLELEAANPATQLDIEGKRLSNEKTRRDLARGETTANITEYNYAKQQGYTGSFDKFLTDKAQKTTVDMRGESEEAKAMGQAAGKRAGETMSAASLGVKQIQRLGQMETLMSRVETGKMAQAKMSLSAWGNALGINDEALRGMGLDPKTVGDAQAMNAIAGRMVIDMIGAGGFPANNFSDADRQFITGTVPQLANTPRGNKIIMEAARRTAQLDIEKAKEWRKWRHANKGGSFDDFDVIWSDKMGSKNHFADLVEQASAITGGQQSPQGQQGRQASPSVGVVDDGYRFNGGDPANPSSWQKVN